MRTRHGKFENGSSLWRYSLVYPPIKPFQEFYCCLPVIIEDYPFYCIELIGIETDHRYGITFHHKPTLLFFLWLSCLSPYPLKGIDDILTAYEFFNLCILHYNTGRGGINSIFLHMDVHPG